MSHAQVKHLSRVYLYPKSTHKSICTPKSQDFTSLTVRQSRNVTTDASLKNLHQSGKRSDLCGFDRLKQKGGPKAKIFTKQILLLLFKEFWINYNTKVGCHIRGEKKVCVCVVWSIDKFDQISNNKICEKMVLLSLGLCGIDGRMLSHKSSIVLPRTVALPLWLSLSFSVFMLLAAAELLYIQTPPSPPPPHPTPPQG